jgi:hypothetical protein
MREQSDVGLKYVESAPVHAKEKRCTVLKHACATLVPNMRHCYHPVTRLVTLYSGMLLPYYVQTGRYSD